MVGADTSGGVDLLTGKGVKRLTNSPQSATIGGMPRNGDVQPTAPDCALLMRAFWDRSRFLRCQRRFLKHSVQKLKTDSC